MDGVEPAAVLETVTGPATSDGFATALAHEHLFVDFLEPTDPGYGRVAWEEVRAVCVARLAEVGRDGVDLLVDCTPLGIGRNVELLREASSASGIRIICATGIYKALRPPDLLDASVEELAERFVHELTVGIDDTDGKAGFVKLATTETGPTEDETTVHRAGAMAATAAGAAIVLHSPQAAVAETVLRTLEREAFAPDRLVWAHAQDSTPAENLALASRGVTVSLDAIGTSDDEDMLDRIGRLADAGCADRILLSSDSSIVVHPPEWAYERDITYVHRGFGAKLEARFGRELRARLTRDNVARAFGRRPPPA
jgi:phosphotriesterase-related protein